MTAIDPKKIINSYRNTFIYHDAVVDVFQAITFTLNKAEEEDEPSSMLLYGATGTGKSKIVDKYLELYMTTGEYITLNVGKNLKDMLLSISSKMGIYSNYRSRASDDHLLEYTIDIIRESPLRLIVLENSQHLFTYERSIQRQYIRDKLLHLSIASGLPVLFIGDHATKLLIEDGQPWKRHIYKSVELTYFTIEDKASIKIYREALKKLAESLPLPVVPELNKMEMAYRLLAASKGMFSDIKDIITMALSNALKRQSDKVELIDFVNVNLREENLENKPFETALSELKVSVIDRYDSYMFTGISGKTRFIPKQYKEISMADFYNILK